jgi:predicted metallo-beta-lactamase superfamily hydrolase
LRFVPIAEESLGVRSVAMYVETHDLRILLDPGISLAPRRFGLPPHPREISRVLELRRVLDHYLSLSTHVFISHYHRDHFTVPYESIYMGTGSDTYVNVYRGKVVLLKDPKDLNYSQRRRYYGLLKAIRSIAREIIYADGKTLEIGSTRVVLSRSLPHGPENSRTGRVVSIAIDDGDLKLLFMPDVQGPMYQGAVDHANSIKPDVLVIGGPPFYLSHVFSEEDIELGIKGLAKIVGGGYLEKLIITHHTLRILEWREKLSEILSLASRKGVVVETYADLLGRSEDLLEARRKELFETEPPPEDYLELFRGSREDED